MRVVAQHIWKRVLTGNLLNGKMHINQVNRLKALYLTLLVKSRTEKIMWTGFIDIEGAFDNVYYESILQAAHNRGVQTAICM